MPRKPLTSEQFRKRVELFRELGVLAYSETEAGFSIQLGPVPPPAPAVRVVPEEALTKEEREARRTKEFRRIATMHNPASRSGH
jgi:hypothetical protein